MIACGGGTEPGDGSDTDTDTDAECDTDTTCDGGVVEFADWNLEKRVREVIDYWCDTLCTEDVEGITVLPADSSDIEDLDGIQALTSLELVNLEDNQISDLSPLVANEGIGSGDSVYVDYNPIDEVAQADNIAALCDRGVILIPFCSE